MAASDPGTSPPVPRVALRADTGRLNRRERPPTERLAEALRAHRHLQGRRILYYDGGASPMNKEVRMWMERAQRRAVLPATGAYHILRRTFCSHLAMQGRR